MSAPMRRSSPSGRRDERSGARIGSAPVIRRLFIANRGEIAMRIIRTARRLGMVAIIAVSDADRESLPARLADEVVPVGPAPSSESYLNAERLVAGARAARADAVHPGYGFLSENAAFARAVTEAGMIFVGPDAATLEAMGDKLNARRAAAAAGLPVLAGGEAGDLDEARRRAGETGYPLLVKAVAGGGGRGMKRVDSPDRLAPQVELAMAEAEAAFGDPRIYVERFIPRGRHVEVQILGDGRRAVHLGDRDCSIQRRYQKLVEEAPAPDIPNGPREALRGAAVRLAESIAYRGAGTVEFLVDAATFDFFFLEMNARIQVEHPVTEAVTGVDLVEQQLLIADGQALGLVQDAIPLTGHAIEARINAEDWRQDFRPSPGTVRRIAWPAGPGIRIDSHVVDGAGVPPHYDSLLGKLIVSGASRGEAVERMRAALDALRVEGVETTVGLHRRIAADPRFAAGAVDTRFLEGLADG
jgi:acetyl-CoA carboxylase biotin carboxylase subunit